MRVFVKWIQGGGDAGTVDLGGGDDLAAVREKVAKVCHVHPSLQQLVFGGELLREEDNKTVAEYGITLEDELRLGFLPAPTVVRLNVGGTPYKTLLSTLVHKIPASVLAKMFDGVRQHHRHGRDGPVEGAPRDEDMSTVLLPKDPDAQHTWFIDRHGPSFEFVLNYLRHDESTAGDFFPLPRDDAQREQLAAEAKYFGLPELAAACECPLRGMALGCGGVGVTVEDILSLSEAERAEDYDRLNLSHPVRKGIEAAVLMRAVEAARVREGSEAEAARVRMEEHGLTSTDQAKLLQDGVTSPQIFSMLVDEDFTTSGIDIAARRAAKAAADQAAADAQGVRDFLWGDGRDISAAGQDIIVRRAGTMSKLCALDLVGIKALGLGIVDARLLANVMSSSATVARFRLSSSIRELQGLSDAGWDTLHVAGMASDEALRAQLRNAKQRQSLLTSLTPADAQLVESLTLSCPLCSPPRFCKTVTHNWICASEIDAIQVRPTVAIMLHGVTWGAGDAAGATTLDITCVDTGEKLFHGQDLLNFGEPQQDWCDVMLPAPVELAAGKTYCIGAWRVRVALLLVGGTVAHRWSRYSQVASCISAKPETRLMALALIVGKFATSCTRLCEAVPLVDDIV